MIHPSKLINIQRKIKDFNENLLMYDQQFVIVPYLASGYIDYSNYGQVDGQRLIDNFETYKRLWTGNDSFIITWKDSVKYTNTEEDTNIKMNYQIGDAILGWLEGNSSVNQIQDDVSFSDYKAQTVEGTLTFRVNAIDFNLDTNWEYMFYKVPEISKNILYRVDSIEREYLGKDLLCYNLTLKALNQDLASTGRAKQQNVMNNAPGQGYYDVKVLEDYTPQSSEIEGIDYKKFYDRWLVADRTKMFNNPVKKVVVKAFGLCGFSNIAFWGRRAYAGGDYRDFGIPRWIFPINITNASTYTLYRTQSEETNYYWIPRLTPIIQFNKEMFDAIKSFLEFNVIWPSQGFAFISKLDGNADTDFSETKGTNPSSDGTYKYQLFGEVVDKGGGVSGYSPWNIAFQTTYRARTDITYGCAQRYDLGGTKEVHNVMFDAFWTQKQLKTLPISTRNTVGFGWTIGSAFAATVAKNYISAFLLLNIGIFAGIAQKMQTPKYQGFSCMVPASLMDFAIDETKTTMGPNLNSKIKLSYFDSYDNDTDIKQLFNTQTMNTSFEADLTDYIVSNRLPGKLLETSVIGQKTFEDGTNILPAEKPFLLNGDAKLAPITDENQGFIIDAFNIQAIFKGDYSIEFLDKQGSVIWSGVFQSQGKWTGSLREINTWVNTSIYGRENMFLAKPLPWPKELPELDLIGIQEKPIFLSFVDYQYGKKVEYGNGTTFEEILTRNLNFVFRNAAGSYAFFQPNETSSTLESSGSIPIRNDWATTLDNFIEKYDGLELKITVVAPQGNYVENEIKNLRVSSIKNFITFNANNGPGPDQTFGLIRNHPTSTGPGPVQYSRGHFFTETWWYFEYAFALRGTTIYLDYKLKPHWESANWSYRLRQNWGRWDDINWNDWKLYNSGRAYTWSLGGDKVKFGSFISNLTVKPKVL